MQNYIAFAFIICVFVPRSLQQTEYAIDVGNLLQMQQGLGSPHHLEVVEGQEVLIKLSQNLLNVQSCVVTTNVGVTFNVNSPPSDTNRFVKWGDCGLRVRNVSVSDEGRWRLVAIRGELSITGWSEIVVKEDTVKETTPPALSLQDGETQTSIMLTSLNNTYCVVAPPFSDSSLVPGHCSVNLEKATRAIQGTWNVLLGLPGKVAEMPLRRVVEVEAERLDVGYIEDTTHHKLHLYCNILHSYKNVTFCRFQKTASSFGYNVMDGLSDGHYSYYGEGFLNKQCGMTIENPTNEDYSTWRCSVGVQEWVGDHLVQASPMQALISVAPSASGRLNKYVERDSDVVVDTVFVEEESSFTLMCRASMSLKYCWFQHPNGTQYTPVQLTDMEVQQYWYTGESLQTGDCGITFAHSTLNEAGLWTCHMGPDGQIGVEVTDTIDVRVTGPLAANQKEVATNIGEMATLYCHTSNGVKPLDYCRFLSPSMLGLHVDSSVSQENAILDRYYFTPNRSVDHGDCSLTISSVTVEDIGEWTCGALIEGDTVEARDTVVLYIAATTRTATLSQAGIIGMVFGLAILVLALGGIVIWKRQGKPIPWRRTTNTTNNTGLTVIYNPDGSRQSCGSGSSDSSGDSNVVISQLPIPART